MKTIIRKFSFLAVLLTFIPNIAAAAVDDEINRMEESRYASTPASSRVGPPQVSDSLI